MLIFVLYWQGDMAAKSNDNPKYKYQIAACLMFQNETFYLKEWIEYHKMLGVEHFYLYNNGSKDDYLSVLKPYILSGELELYQYPKVGKNQAEHNHIQCDEVYTHVLALARGKVKWLAIIDADEFIFPVQEDALLDILNRYEGYGGLYLDYVMFGTSHLKKIPRDALIIESFVNCAEKVAAFGKSIVRPERVSKCTDPHRMWYHPPYFHVDTSCRAFDWTPECTAEDVLLIYHYYTGDEKHVKSVKFPRRRKWSDIKLNTYLKELEWTNAKYNFNMEKFVPELRERMRIPYRPYR